MGARPRRGAGGTLHPAGNGEPPRLRGGSTVPNPNKEIKILHKERSSLSSQEALMNGLEQRPRLGRGILRSCNFPPFLHERSAMFIEHYGSRLRSTATLVADRLKFPVNRTAAFGSYGSGPCTTLTTSLPVKVLPWLETVTV